MDTASKGHRGCITGSLALSLIRATVDTAGGAAAAIFVSVRGTTVTRLTRLASVPIGATVYAAGRTQIAVEIILGYKNRRSASYSRRARLKMEVEGGRGDKEGIEGQVMSAPGRCANAIKKDIVVPEQAGVRTDASVDHWDRGAPIVDIVEHSDIGGIR